MTKTKIYYANIGKRFTVDTSNPNVEFMRAPNDKAVRRNQRRGVMAHKSKLMQKIDGFRKELGALAPAPGKHPWQKREEARRREAAQVAVQTSTSSQDDE